MGPSPRGGAYSYDWIENLLGLNMHSVDSVLPEFQHPEIGETIGFGSNRMRLEQIEPEHMLAWRSEDGNWVWTFVLTENDGHTRLISRNRFRLPTLAARIGMLPMEPGSLVMERKMLRGIKQRGARSRSAQPCSDGSRPRVIRRSSRRSDRRVGMSQWSEMVSTMSPALKSSRLASAQGGGTQMARSVSDLVLISGDFASVPVLVAEGRRALRNLERVTKLYVTKSAFAAFLILTIGTSSDAYPLLPRHLTLAASLTIGIPTFFLALAPSSGPWRPERFVRGVARFAVPAGALLGAGLVAGYLFALHDLDLSVRDSRTVAVTILVACGLYLVLALEAEGSRRRSTLVGGMCAVLAGLFVAALLLPATRRFFELNTLDVGMVVTAVCASAVAIAALALSGYSVRVGPPPSNGGP